MKNSQFRIQTTIAFDCDLNATHVGRLVAAEPGREGGEGWMGGRVRGKLIVLIPIFCVLCWIISLFTDSQARPLLREKLTTSVQAEKRLEQKIIFTNRGLVVLGGAYHGNIQQYSPMSNIDKKTLADCCDH